MNAFEGMEDFAMPITVGTLDEPTGNPPCPHCTKPGQANRNGLGVPAGASWWYCTNPQCTAPTKPHNWYTLAGSDWSQTQTAVKGSLDPDVTKPKK
jgi:hypothetical protein